MYVTKINKKQIVVTKKNLSCKLEKMICENQANTVGPVQDRLSKNANKGTEKKNGNNSNEVTKR